VVRRGGAKERAPVGLWKRGRGAHCCGGGGMKLLLSSAGGA